jgi:hypothetical protein
MPQIFLRDVSATIGFCVLAIAHAALVFSLWYAAIFLDKHVISATHWLVVGWSWLLWFRVLVPRIRGEAKLVIPAILVCVGLIVPCVSTIYTFTVWTFGGVFS